MIFKYIYIAVRTDNEYQIINSQSLTINYLWLLKSTQIYNEQFIKDIKSLFPVKNEHNKSNWFKYISLQKKSII